MEKVPNPNEYYDELKKIFRQKYGEHEVTVFAPGRANIIGEHTDYNEGFVLPFAISQGVWFLASPNSTGEINIFAYDTGGETEILLNRVSIHPSGWEIFFRQVISTLQGFHINGANIVFGGNLPIGAGISSSSSITCGFVEVLNRLNHWHMSPDIILQKAVTAEWGYGVQGGIMDQFTIINGRKNKAILLDCRDNSTQYIDMEMGEYCFYLFNTNVKHNLIDTDYNNRRYQCDNAVSILNQQYKPISSLRDIEKEELPEVKKILDKVLYQRVSFVVEENERVLLTKDAIENQDFKRLGELLYASHDGLSHKYEVSCPELDWLVNYTMDQPNIIGARMMGGGFGGCTINLVKGYLADDWIRQVIHRYEATFGFQPTIIHIKSEDGILAKRN